MKKIVGILSLFLLFGFGATAVFGEETASNQVKETSAEKTKEKEMTTESSNAKETTQTTTKETQTNQAVVDPGLTAKIAEEKMFLNAYLARGFITQESFNSYLSRIDSVKTEEELKKIVDELLANTDIVNYRWAFSERYINLKINIEEYGRMGVLSENQVNKFLQRLEAAKTLEEIEQISQEVKASANTSEGNNVSEVEKVRASRFLEILLANAFITQEEYSNFSKELNSIKTKVELDAFYKRVANVSKETEHFIGSFYDSYYNIQAGITTSLNQGKITKEQADKLLAQLDAARTQAELDKVFKELNDLINNKDPQTSTTNPSKDKETNNGIDNKAKKGFLPQTGESADYILAGLGILLVTSMAGYVIIKRA
ncbi:LPXTG cell wall anchor domain-containing protein [Vagococcus carniphilus]|uniref:LPXTG cell wall anchor domain-containing protein n=1 Tax=Vagococcus carniphilus TaxID=218144 RepID=UPI003B58BBDE